MWITPSGSQRPGADTYADKVMTRPEDYRVLERLPLDKNSIPITFKNTGKPVRWIAIIDTETTGLTSDAKVLELAVIRCGVDDSGNLCSIDEILDEFNDPGFEIPEKISKITGITDEMVSGKSVNMAKLEHILRDDPIIMAHNASFDRPIFESICHDDNHEWVCSLKYCNWHDRGFSGNGLGVLLQQEGYFFNAHRAYMDCLALAMLLYVVPDSLAEILTSRVKVIAGGNSYDVKDALKTHRYAWNAPDRIWYKIVPNDIGGVNVDNEMDFLKNLYTDGSKSSYAKIDRRKEFKTVTK